MPGLGQDRPSSRGEDRRADIDGLRGVTMAAVVTFHAWPTLAPGGFVGVDVFYVLSGLLITGLLLREQESSGSARIDLRRFYARRMRRLLPAASLVTVVTVAWWWAFGPRGERVALAVDAASAALFGANLRFAIVANDYFSDEAVSPLLHLWSLGVEEQFYLVWPLLLWLAARAARGSRRRLAVFAVLVVIASAGCSVALTEVEPSWAFFGSPARAWQLGAGALLAILDGRARGMARHVAGIAGALLLAGAVFGLDGDMPYPGTAAFLPIGGAVLLVLAGPLSVTGRMLSLPPLRVLGDLSYSWYLWHWPILVAISARADGAPRPLHVALGVLASGLAAALTWRYVENPLRYARAMRPNHRSFALGAALTLLSLSIAAASWSSARPRGPKGVYVARRVGGAPARWRIVAGLELDLATGASTRPPLLSPDPLLAGRDNARAWVPQCVTDRRDARVRDCVLGDDSAPRIVALVGDSHAAQWLAALDLVGRAGGWRVVPLLKTACPIGDLPVWNRNVGGAFPQCDAWRRRVERRIAALRPDAIVVATRADYYRLLDSGVRSDAEDSAGAMLASFARVVRRWQAQGAHIVFLVDTPVAGVNVPRCLVDRDEPAACDFPAARRGPMFAGNAPWLEAMSALGATVVDLTAQICPDPDRCPAVIDNVVVYRDDDHLTATFAATLATPLLRALEAADDGSAQPAQR